MNNTAKTTKQTLPLEKRTVVGRKVKKLRKEGIVPASLYGKKVKSIAVQVDLKEFEKVFKEVGETGVIELKLDGKNRPSLIKNLHIHPVTDQILHVDFYQVDLTEKIKASIPLEIINDAPAVIDKKGVLLTILDAVDVEALPADLPEKIEVDASKLNDVDQVISVSQLPIPSKLTVLTDGEREVVKIGPLVTKEAEKQAAEDEIAQAAVKAEAAPPEVEGEEKKEGEVEGEKEEAKEKQPQEDKAAAEAASDAAEGKQKAPTQDSQGEKKEEKKQ